MRYLINNASVVGEGEIYRADVLLDGGIIAAIFRNGAATDSVDCAERIDASGRYLIPGVIDEHVHFRDPGLTYKADILSESRAAVSGGVTSFIDMPNTAPPTLTNAALDEKFGIAAQKSLANFSFYIGASRDNLEEIRSLDTSRVAGVKLFMGSSTGDMLLDDDLSLESLFHESPCLIAAHCEDERTIREDSARIRQLIAKGKITSDASIHPLVRSSRSCLEATRRAVKLARKTGARLHVLHVSTSDELALFSRDIPLQQKRITAETCPHYLLMDSRDYSDRGYLIKCNPAIKSPEDRDALVAALRGGAIDTIGTDHAPHLLEEKNTGDYNTAKSGFPSIQHSLELMNEMVRVGALTMCDMVRLMCHNPAILYGIDRRGFIREGYHADLVLLDADGPHTISGSMEVSKCGWTPYEGRQVHLRVTHTFVNGNLVFENGVVHEDFRGQMLKFNR